MVSHDENISRMLRISAFLLFLHVLCYCHGVQGDAGAAGQDGAQGPVVSTSITCQLALFLFLPGAMMGLQNLTRVGAQS